MSNHHCKRCFILFPLVLVLLKLIQIDAVTTTEITTAATSTHILRRHQHRQVQTTVITTDEPTQAPSHTPTPLPTISPTRQLTQQPSIKQTQRPSSHPSMKPSLSIQEQNIGLTMDFTGIDDLSRDGQPRYQSVTEEFLRDSINKMENSDGDIFQLDIQVAVINILDPLVVTGGARQRSRLNESDPSLMIVVDALIRFKSTKTYSLPVVMNWVKSAFDEEEEKAQYLSQLKVASSDFELAVTVDVSLGGYVVPIQEPESESGTDNTFLWIALAAAVVIVLALATLGIILLWMRADQSSTTTAGKTNPTEEYPDDDRNSNIKPPSGPSGLQTDILVERQDDISTLGDPVFGGGMMMMTNANAERDEQTASLCDDYDYAKQYMPSQGASLMDEASRSRFTSTDSGSGDYIKQGPLGTSVFADDASFEKQYDTGERENRFDVEVPAGKLGMVIDTPDGNSPMVHAIKPDSVLANHVRVGDRLVSVDGEDVTALTAIQVSKLISLKSDDTRLLSFARSLLRDDSLTQLQLE